MLQNFIMQDCTAEELHFLLSVRARGSVQRGRGAEGSGPEPGIGLVWTRAVHL